MCILRAENICKYYKNAEENISVLKNVSFAIEQGEIVAVMGPSGSGKTTILQTLCGIDVPDTGSIYIAGQEFTAMSEDERSNFRKRNLGIIFQDFQLLESLTVKENILLPLIINEIDISEQERIFQEVVKPLEISGIENRGITEISGGQMQRTAIARAFVHNPCLIFADEPTGNLDFHATNEVMKCILKMNRLYGTSVMLVTHDAHVAAFCHRVLLLKDGHFQEEIRRDENDYEAAIAKMLCGMGGGCQ